MEDAGIYYNSLGVDPVSGEVYFATLKGYADYKTNDIAIFDFNKTPALQFDIKIRIVFRQEFSLRRILSDHEFLIDSFC